MNTDGILKCAVVVVFFVVATTVPVATACVDCAGFLVDRSNVGLGYHEVELVSCRVSITIPHEPITWGASTEGCSVVCDRCSDPDNVIGFHNSRCTETYPGVNVLDELCVETLEGSVDSPIVVDQSGYYIPGGVSQADDVSCKTQACSGTRSFKNKTPITFTYNFDIHYEKWAYCCPFLQDDDESTWVLLSGSQDTTSSGSQTMYLFGTQQNESICTSDELSQCLTDGLILNCGSNNQ